MSGGTFICSLPSAFRTQRNPCRKMPALLWAKQMRPEASHKIRTCLCIESFRRLAFKLLRRRLISGGGGLTSAQLDNKIAEKYVYLSLRSPQEHPRFQLNVKLNLQTLDGCCHISETRENHAVPAQCAPKHNREFKKSRDLTGKAKELFLL